MCTKYPLQEVDAKEGDGCLIHTLWYVLAHNVIMHAAVLFPSYFCQTH